MKSTQTLKTSGIRPASASAFILLSLLTLSVGAEVPSDPPGKYFTSWLGNTYKDAAGHKNVTEGLSGLCLSPNGKIFTARDAATWGGVAEHKAGDGGFVASYDRFESGFGAPVECVAADAEFAFWGTPGKGILRSAQGGGSKGAYTTGIGHVRILNKADGRLVVTLRQNVNGWKGSDGWVDAAYGMTVTQRKNGEYVVLFENVAWTNIMMARWCPSGTCSPSPASTP